eukprot:m.134549 g.134549  ORF g.134549 m.134549 type:complete len:1212 (-) comp29744_c1_seq4:108-3743(-)
MFRNKSVSGAGSGDKTDGKAKAPKRSESMFSRSKKSTSVKSPTKVEATIDDLHLDLYFPPLPVSRSLQLVSNGIAQPQAFDITFPATSQPPRGVGVGFIKSAKGVFINSIQSRSMAAKSDKVVIGMCLTNINGKSCEGYSLGKLDTLANAGGICTLTLRYDPSLYASVDGGVELRRIQLLVYQGDTPNLDRHIAVGRYLDSCAVSSSSDFQAIRSIDVLISNKKDKLFSKISISNYGLVLETQTPFSIPLIDIERCIVKNANVSIIQSARTFDKAAASKVVLLCHVINCKTKTIATALGARINERQNDGQLRLKQAVRRSMAAKPIEPITVTADGSSKAMSDGGEDKKKVKRGLTKELSTAKQDGAVDQKVKTPKTKKASKSPKASSAPVTVEDDSGMTAADVGKRCTVKGYDCEGVIRFVGPDVTSGKVKVGIELDEPLGKNDGNVKGNWYFSSPANHGVLVIPKKVTFLSNTSPEQFGGFVAEAPGLDDDYDGFDDDDEEEVAAAKSNPSSQRNSGDFGSGSEDTGSPNGSEPGTRRLTFSTGQALTSSNGEDNFDDFDDDVTPAVKPVPTALDLTEDFSVQCTYHGSTVHSDSTTDLANVAAFCYFDIVEDESNEKVPSTLRVSKEIIDISDRKTEDALQSHSILELLYWEDLEDGFIVYITSPRFGTLKRQGRVKFCHVVQVKPKQLQATKDHMKGFLAWAMGEHEEEKEKSSSVNNLKTNSIVAQVSEDPIVEEKVDAFRARWLGHLVLPPGKVGMAVAKQCVASLALKKKIKPLQVAIVIEPTGMRVIDEVSQDVTRNVLTTSLLFASPISDPDVLKLLKGKFKAWNQPLTVMMYQDSSGRNICDLYSTGKRTKTISDSMKSAYAEEARRRTEELHPFAAISTSAAVDVQGPLAEFQIPRESLIPLKAIGQGEFGQVYMAQQIMQDGTGGREVRACKLLKTTAGQEDSSLFLREVEIMIEFDHPNVLLIVGICIEHRPWIAVLEYMQYNDLRKTLRYSKDQQVTLTPVEMLMLAEQIAFGMMHLVEKKYIHMDLAARNILVGDNSIVKVADFGSATKLPEGKTSYKLDRKCMVSVKWAAYEAITKRKFSQKSDVWSFGICMWEIFSYGAQPYKGIKPTQMLTKITEEKIRLAKPDNCADVWFQLMMSCWRELPAERPSFTKIRAKLQKYIAGSMSQYGKPRDIGIAIREGKNVGQILVDDEEDDV